MKRFFGKYCKAYLIRPTIYKTVTKLLLTAVFGGIWSRFGNKYGFFSPILHITSSFTVIFAVLAWFSFLRLDGVRLPRIKNRRKKKKRMHTMSDLTDHLDTEIIPFEELDEDERDFCSMLSSLVCFALCLLISAVLILID